MIKHWMVLDVARESVNNAKNALGIIPKDEREGAITDLWYELANLETKMYNLRDKLAWEETKK